MGCNKKNTTNKRSDFRQACWQMERGMTVAFTVLLHYNIIQLILPVKNAFIRYIRGLRVERIGKLVFITLDIS